MRLLSDLIALALALIVVSMACVAAAWAFQLLGYGETDAAATLVLLGRPGAWVIGEAAVLVHWISERVAR